MSAVSRERKLSPNERDVTRVFLPAIVLFLVAGVGFGLILPLVHIFYPRAETITANEFAGMVGLMCLSLLCFVLLLQNKILDLQRRVADLEKVTKAQR
jgi:hypothetical protein